MPASSQFSGYSMTGQRFCSNVRAGRLLPSVNRYVHGLENPLTIWAISRLPWLLLSARPGISIGLLVAIPGRVVWRAGVLSALHSMCT